MKKLLSILLLMLLATGLIFGSIATSYAEETGTDTTTDEDEEAEEEPEDSDDDGIPDEDDNCPETHNPAQYDGNDNDTGIVCDSSERDDFLETLAEITDAQIQSNEGIHEETYEQTMSEFGFCIETTSPLIPQQCQGNDPNRRMEQLAEGLTNQQIVTILEEPIGNKNVYTRARICRTRFLKSKYGLLQPAPGQGDGYEFNFRDIEDAEDLDEIREGYRSSINNDTQYLITLGKCEERFVEKCEIQNTEQNDRFAKLAEPLPVKVFCDRVQVLFATSGTGIIKSYVGLIYGWASGIIGLIAVLVIVINGIMMSASNGDQGAVENARNRIMRSLSAIAILFLSGLILYSINPNFFTASDLQAPRDSGARTEAGATTEATESDSTPTDES